MKPATLFLLMVAGTLLHSCTQTREEYYPSGRIRVQVEVNGEGIAHGKGTYYHESGGVSSEGQFVDGSKKGPWKWYYDSTGTLYMTGSFTDGAESGIFTEFYPEGSLHKIALFKEGKMDGISHLYRPDGSKESVVAYRAGLRQDTSWFYHPNGVLSMVSIARNDTIFKYTEYDSLGGKRKEFILFPDSADFRAVPVNSSAAVQ